MNYHINSRYYDPYLNQYLSRDPFSGYAQQPQSQNGYSYGNNNPINYVDPTGLIACKDSSDPLCIVKLQALYSYGESLKYRVKLGTLEPVEALAQLANKSVISFGEADGFMWGMTNLVLGIDPNDTQIWRIGLAYRYNYNSNANPHFLGFDWLLYKNDPSKGEDHSERGDWNPRYWDGTGTQAFHFWYFVATTYYNGSHIANTANLHDSYFLEPICGDDLSRLHGLPIIGSSIQVFGRGTSKEDFQLSLKGIQLGRGLWWSVRLPSVCVSGRCTPSSLPWGISNPSGWIRQNLR